MIQLWVIYALLGGVLSNIFNFFNRLFLKDQGDATSWAWFFEFLRLPVFLIAAFFDNYVKLNIYSIIILFGVGISECLSTFFYMKMHAHTHLSISTILYRTRIIWIPILAFLFINEHLSNLEYIGIVILFIGLSTVVAPHRFFIDKGALYANLAGFFTAVNTLFLKAAIPYASTSIIMVAMSFFPSLIFPFFIKNVKQRIKAETTKQLSIKLVAVAINVISSYLLLFALQRGNASLVNAVYQSMMVLSVLAGIIILKEHKDLLRKLLGTAITLIGVILVG